MTQGLECEDCFIARTHDWPVFHAGCVGCHERMLESPPQRNDATDEMIQLLGTPKKETA